MSYQAAVSCSLNSTDRIGEGSVVEGLIRTGQKLGDFAGDSAGVVRFIPADRS